MAITNRNQLIREVYQLLNKEGFETSNIYEQSCFDIVARKKLLILLLKVLVNIDSINESHVEEIRQISNVFLASPIIVGVKSKNHILEEDVVYERHGLPAIGIETLKNMIVYDEYPEILADRGGYYVQINGNVLKEYREEYNLSLKDLADLAHVSRATMYKYENGMVRANTETAMLLEEILN
uniref:helix-turn-helix domain-containing protein n=1 Tax=uncultured Methanobrevibacter sp. TaxID=253161 RepID=UPI00374434FE